MSDDRWRTFLTPEESRRNLRAREKERVIDYAMGLVGSTASGPAAAVLAARILRARGLEATAGTDGTVTVRATGYAGEYSYTLKYGNLVALVEKFPRCEFCAMAIGSHGELDTLARYLCRTTTTTPQGTGPLQMLCYRHTETFGYEPIRELILAEEARRG